MRARDTDQVADGATLAEAICCDSAFEPYAEPQFLFRRGDVNLFAEMEKFMDEDGTVTFYDSVCGEPLYRAPVGRTMEEFMEESSMEESESISES